MFSIEKLGFEKQHFLLNIAHCYNCGAMPEYRLYINPRDGEDPTLQLYFCKKCFNEICDDCVQTKMCDEKWAYFSESDIRRIREESYRAGYNSGSGAGFIEALRNHIGGR